MVDNVLYDLVEMPAYTDNVPTELVLPQNGRLGRCILHTVALLWAVGEQLCYW